MWRSFYNYFAYNLSKAFKPSRAVFAFMPFEILTVSVAENSESSGDRDISQCTWKLVVLDA